MASLNFSTICLNERQLMVHGTEFELYLQRFVFPAIAVLGILGNALNLTVLLNRSMRSRANTFLAVLAFADIIFLSLLVPNILANYPMFTYNNYFRFFYFNTKIHLLSLANWWSAVAIWCVIAVCTDRLIGIRHPLYVRDDWAWYKMPTIIAVIILSTGLFTFYQHFEYECLSRWFCNGTQLYSKCININHDPWFGNQTNPHSRNFRLFMSVSVAVYALSMIILPIILLTFLNVLLICALRQRQHNLSSFNSAAAAPRPLMAKKNSEASSIQKTEHRVTLTVAFIVTMFTLTNGPSAAIHLFRALYHLGERELYNLTMLCSTLVICGKASNFILFCLCSKHFRLRLIKLTQKKMGRKIGGVEKFQENVLALFTVMRFWRRPNSETLTTSLLDRTVSTKARASIGHSEAASLHTSRQRLHSPAGGGSLTPAGGPRMSPQPPVNGAQGNLGLL